MIDTAMDDVKRRIKDQAETIYDRIWSDLGLTDTISKRGSGGYYVASPLRGMEATPSFHVNAKHWGWRDFGAATKEMESGDVLKLCALVWKLDIVTDFPKILERCCDILGIPFEKGSAPKRGTEERFLTEAHLYSRNKREIEEMCKYYGLTWKDFEEAGAKLVFTKFSWRDTTSKEWHGSEEVGISYPLINIHGEPGEKVKSLSRFDLKVSPAKKMPYPEGKRLSKHAGAPGLFPPPMIARLRSRELAAEKEGGVSAQLVVTGGEEKALVLLAAGIYAITGSNGETMSEEEVKWIVKDCGINHIIMAFDNDTKGKSYSQSVADMFWRAGAKMVRNVFWCEDLPNKYDVCDVRRDYGNYGVKRLIEHAPIAAEEKPHEKKSPVWENSRKMTMQVFKADGNVGFKAVSVSKSMNEITGQLYSITNNWPRSTDSGMLFAVNEDRDVMQEPQESDITTIVDSNDLFAFAGRKCVWSWNGKEAFVLLSGKMVTPPTKTEVFAYIKAKPYASYSTVEMYPHHPPLKDAYYVPWNYEASASKCPFGLRDIIAILNPASEVDRMLIVAAMLTPLWGGRPGARPLFMFQARHRGAGKTATATSIANIFGGFIQYTLGADQAKTSTIFLSPDALKKKIVLIDNVKKKVDNADLDAWITAPDITGHRMYEGFAKRPNFLTWFLTMNAAEGSADAGRRSVVINIGKPQNTDFTGRMNEIITTSKPRIIHELISILKRPHINDVGVMRGDDWVPEPLYTSGFNTWEKEVICRLQPMDMDHDDEPLEGMKYRRIGPKQLLEVIAMRRKDVDADAKLSNRIAAKLFAVFEKFYLDRVTTTIVIPRSVMKSIVNKVTDNPGGISDAGLKQLMMSLCGVGDLEPLTESANKDYCGEAYPFVWLPEKDQNPGMAQVIPLSWDSETSRSADSKTIHPSHQEEMPLGDEDDS